MQVIDIRQNVRVAILLEMLEDVSRASEPEQAVRAYAARIGKIRPVDAMIAVSTRNLPPGHYKITRRVLPHPETGEPVHILGNPWKNWKNLPMHSGGFLGELIAAPEPRLIHDLFLRGDPVLGDSLAEMGACLAIPVFDGGRVMNWTIQFRRSATGFSINDLEEHVLTGNLFGSMTRNLVSLEQIRRLNERLEKQFEEVARVQQSLLPERLPRVPGLAIATSYLTSSQAGGDYYDFFELPGDRLGILVADVSGHGPAAATVMAMLHAILHSYPAVLDNPAEVLRYANQRLLGAARGRGDGSFVTAVLAVYDPGPRRLTLARAGHPLPRLKDTRTGEVRELDGQGGLPLGIVDEYEIANHCVTLEPGQTVVLYTDGITEAFSEDRRMFGVEGLDAALEACSGEPDCVVDSVHGALYRHTGKRTREDDQTLVAIKVQEA